MRVLLFTGEGGVGKTTLAAATALRLAGSGHQVLVVSTDPAHSLADALDRTLGAEPVEVAAGLSAVQLDATALLEARWGPVREAVADVVGSPREGVAGLQAEELTVLPGVEELVTLAEVRRLAGDGQWDVLVVDCGPTAETVRMLALPEAVGGYLRRVWPRHRRVLHALGGRLAVAAAAVDRLEAEAAAVHELLTDAGRTSVRLVLTPERVVLAETRRTRTAMALHGMSVAGVVVNRVLPAPRTSTRSKDPAWGWLQQRGAEQAEVLAVLRAELGSGVPVTTVGYRAAEPVGVAALEGLAEELYGDGPPSGALATPGPRVELESGTGLDSVYLWRLPLPLVDDTPVELGRVEDDLLVSVGGHRRRLELPPVLRRCRSVDAEVGTDEVGNDELLVRFSPDERLWLR